MHQRTHLSPIIKHNNNYYFFEKLFLHLYTPTKIMRGLIYAMIGLENDKKEIYIGSTTKSLAARIGQHSRAETSGGRTMLDKYGEKLECCELANYDICDIKHLHAYEALYIEKYRHNTKFNVINKLVPFQISFLTKSVWHRRNAERLRAEGAKYRAENQDSIKKYRAEYNGVAIKCGCGGSYHRQHRAEHNRSIKHNNFVDAEYAAGRGAAAYRHNESQ